MWFRRKRSPQDFSQEIQSHIDLEAERLVSEGMNPSDARSAAIRRFGGVAAAEERFYEWKRMLWLDHLGQDLRYALRGLKRNPGFGIVAILTLAIGIGANTAVFSVVDPLLFEKLPVRHPEELVSITPIRPDLRILIPTLPEALSGKASNGVTYREFERLRDGNDVLAGIFVWGGSNSGMRLLNDDGQFTAPGKELVVDRVSTGFFRTLNAVPAAGRDFTQEDDTATAAPVGIISYALWRQQFSLDPNVIGKRLTLMSPSTHPEDDDVRITFTVVGVAPRGFSGLEVGAPRDMWVPLQGRPDGDTPTDLAWWRGHLAIARLRPGVRAEEAQTRLNALFGRIQSEWANEFGESWRQNQKEQFTSQGLSLESFATGWNPLQMQFGERVTVLMTAVGSVLLIACINVAVLLLARSGVRRKELAIRLSIGGGRLRLVRQLLIESLVIAVLGATLGLVIAHWSARLLLAYTPELARLDITLDLRILGFTMATAVASAIVFGLVPALRSTTPDVSPWLKEARIGAGRTRSPFALNKLLIASQIALSLVLLVGAGLFVRTLRNLSSVDTGFDRENVVVFNLSRAVELSRLEQLFGRIEVFPGIQSATTWDTGMLSPGITMVGPVHVDGKVARQGEDLWSFATAVGPRFFETVGVSLVSGREFQPADSGRRVAVINETMARFFFGNENPIGRYYNAGVDPKWRTEIIGVAEDTKYVTLTGAPPRVTYTPLSSNGEKARSSKFAVRASASLAAVSNAIITAVKEIDGRLQVINIHTLEDSVQGKLVQQRFVAHCAGLFSALALLLACIGLHGTLSNAVTQRTNEIGIRMALGARTANVVGMLMRETGWILGIGLLCGLLGAFVATRAISSLLYGLTPTDPSTFTGAALLLIAAAVAAAYLPSRRASRVDPVIALRHD